MVSSPPNAPDTLPGPARDRLIAVRMIVAAAASPGVELSVSSLARACVLPEWVVEHVLHSPRFAELLGASSRNHVATLLTRVLARLEEVLERGTPNQALRAIQALINLSRTLELGAAVHQDLVGKAAPAKLLQELESRRTGRNIEDESGRDA